MDARSRNSGPIQPLKLAYREVCSTNLSGRLHSCDISRRRGRAKLVADLKRKMRNRKHSSRAPAGDNGANLQVCFIFRVRRDDRRFTTEFTRPPRALFTCCYTGQTDVHDEGFSKHPIYM
jgi:hypothetical protein